WLNLYLGFPVLLLVLLCLMFWNFKWLHEDWKFWRHNFIAVLAAFTFISILTHSIYFRFWESFVRLEAPHGAARLSASKPVKLVFSASALRASRLRWTPTAVFGFGANRAGTCGLRRRASRFTSVTFSTKQIEGLVQAPPVCVGQASCLSPS